MKPIRLVILGTALAAGIGAAIMVASPRPPEAPRLTIVHAPVVTDEVLVASKELLLGTVIEKDDLHWQSWPRGNVNSPTPFAKAWRGRRLPITRAHSCAIRSPLENRSFPTGSSKPAMRASCRQSCPPACAQSQSTSISKGRSRPAASSFPNDHVDVIHTYRDEDAAKAGVPNPMVSETILRNIKVLAIGQNIQEHNNERVVVGSNATLELTPQQVETIVLAQRIGQLSLSLRSLADSKVLQEQ